MGGLGDYIRFEKSKNAKKQNTFYEFELYEMHFDSENFITLRFI